jgi:phosphoketolase
MIFAVESGETFTGPSPTQSMRDKNTAAANNGTTMPIFLVLG